jgi:hypothetical protein
MLFHLHLIAVDYSTAISSTPTLTHVIADGDRDVVGVTSVDDLYSYYVHQVNKVLKFMT